MADLDHLEAKIDSLTKKVDTGFSEVNGKVETGFSSVNEKLVKIQEAMYELARKTEAPAHAEEFRESLPDQPKKKAEFVR